MPKKQVLCKHRMKSKVFKSTGSWYKVETPDGKLVNARLRGKFKTIMKGVTNPLAVGDWVDVEVEDEANDAYLITYIEPRTNYVMRRSVHNKHQAHLIACNVDQAMIVASLVFPKTSLGFIDRFLVSVESFSIPAVVVFNKHDLLEEDKGLLEYEAYLFDLYTSLGYTCVKASVLTGEGMPETDALLKGKTTLLTGLSGVGKSSILNHLHPELDLRTGEVSTYANKGTHTTTYAEMFRIDKETCIIDTPGIKEWGIIELGDDTIAHCFPEFRALLGGCKFYNCTHLHEPGCKVMQAVESGEIAESRYFSYVSIVTGEDNRR